MNLSDNWNRLNVTHNNEIESLLSISLLQKVASKSPLSLLKKNLFASFLWCTIISLFYSIIILKTSFWYIQYCLAVPLFFTISGAFSCYKLYKSIGYSLELPVVSNLKNNLKNILLCKKNNEKLALFVYPFCAIGGFLLGLEFTSHQPLEELLGSTKIIIIFIVSSLLFVILGYNLAKWMFAKAYGESILQLQNNINLLENSE
jgi:hypothetical protein